MIRELDEIDYGYVCSTCGLSDVGLERLCSFGFNRNPCLHCADHFTRQPITDPAWRKRRVGTAARKAIARSFGVEMDGVPYPAVCGYCGAPGTITWRPGFRHAAGYMVPPTILSSMEWDHRVPWSRGGDDSIENVTLCCQRCNVSKGDKTVDEWIAWMSTPAALRSSVDRVAILARLAS